MKKYINILIIPEGGQPSHNFRISTMALKIMAGTVAVWVLILIVFTVFYGRLSYQARIAEEIRQENERLRDYNLRVVEIEKSFQKNRELTARIAALAGIELEQFSPAKLPTFDSLADTNLRQVVSGLAGDNPVVANEDLEKMRVPRGRPLYGWITRAFVADSTALRDKHDGIDIAVKEGTPVVATATGEVAFSGWDKDYGFMVIIDHGNEFKTVYGHNQKNIVTAGEKVHLGQVIALSGNTGRSTAPHLHYGILKNGEPVDPSPYMD